MSKLFYLILFFSLNYLTFKAEDPKTGIIEPMLEPDKALLDKIKNLPENSWLKLPNLKVVGDLEGLPANANERAVGPFGRSYCGYAVWAPERQRAIYMGGGHNVRRQSDVWEYDLASNTWVCLLGVDPAGVQRSTEEWFRENTVMAADGTIITKSGGPVAISHTWNQFCYDPDRKVALWVNSMPRSVEYSVKLDKEDNVAAKGLGIPFDEFKKKLCKDGTYVWEFDPAKRKFTKREFIVNTNVPGNTIGGRQEEGTMRYISDLKTVFFSGSLRDPKTGEWKAFGGKGSPPWYGYSGEYDPETKQFFVHAGPWAKAPNCTYAMAIPSGEWKLVSSKGPTDYGVKYDTVAKELIAMTLEEKIMRVWGFDSVKNEWHKKPNSLGDLPEQGPYGISYYDPLRNVHVYYNSIDVYVYRVKKVEKND